jgi:hypothetical protein
VLVIDLKVLFLKRSGICLSKNTYIKAVKIPEVAMDNEKFLDTTKPTNIKHVNK